MPFGIFKKKKKEDATPHYDPTDIRIVDVRKGFMLDYNGKTWQATEEYEYDWGNSYFTYEMKLVSGNETIFLSIDEGDMLELQVLHKLNFSRLDPAIEQAILDEDRPPRQITLEGKTFFRADERPGYFRNIDNEDWAEFISWDYFDEAEQYVLNIEQWEDHHFEASFGRIVSEHEFSNILPAPSGY